MVYVCKEKNKHFHVPSCQTPWIRWYTRGNVQFFSLCPKLTAIFQLANYFNRVIYFCKLKAREDWAKFFPVKLSLDIKSQINKFSSPKYIKRLACMKTSFWSPVTASVTFFTFTGLIFGPNLSQKYAKARKFTNESVIWVNVQTEFFLGT